MERSEGLVDLGFTETPVPPGTHICQIYSDSAERDESLLRFLLRGLEAQERCASFSDRVPAERISNFLDTHGQASEEMLVSGALSLSGSEEIYFADGVFDPDRMLEVLIGFYESARADGYRAARVIGEMSPRIGEVDGGGRLLEYEARVSQTLRTHPVTAVCQYDAHRFDGATIMDVLKVHPMMVIRGAVIHNPFYVPPEELLR